MSRPLFVGNRPRSIYQYSNMAPRLSDQTSIFGVVFFVWKSLLGIEGQRKLEKFAILTRKPRSHARILIYRTWPICRQCYLQVTWWTLGQWKGRKKRIEWKGATLAKTFKTPHSVSSGQCRVLVPSFRGLCIPWTPKEQFEITDSGFPTEDRVIKIYVHLLRI